MNANEVYQGNCSKPSILEFPRVMRDVPPRYDFVFIAVVTSAYVFLAMGIVCDTFFVPAVEHLCLKLHMPYDIAGTTLMAATTSAPEFFVNVVAAFITEGDIGVGTIVGSAVFNTLGIVACCGIFSKATIFLDWWPISRDIFWYCIAVIVLTVVIWDSIIMWYESVLLITMHIVNLLYLIYDRRIQSHVRTIDVPSLSCFTPIDKVTDILNPVEINRKETSDKQEDENIFNVWNYPKDETYLNQLHWLICWPWQFLFFLTIPAPTSKIGKVALFLNLLMCVIWISVLCYLATWMITVIGFNLFLPDSVMGITLLAVGTSVPELVASIIVTRKGYGSMAVCNAVGSNTFDIFLCLGIPWLLKSIFAPKIQNNYMVIINSTGLVFASCSLLTTALLMYLSFMSTRFGMGSRVGYTCLLLYFVYLIIACMVELNMFGQINLPLCKYVNE